MDATALLLNAFAFYFFTKILGPQFSISAVIWVKLSVILAALTTAVFTFSSYKFFVFKK
jgi:hypothetical protein